MTSPTARAASLAAALTVLTGEQAVTGRDTESGAPTVDLLLPTPLADQVWKSVHLSLLALPSQDEFGSLREPDGSIRLWAVCHDPPDTS